MELDEDEEGGDEQLEGQDQEDAVAEGLRFWAWNGFDDFDVAVACDASLLSPVTAFI